MVRPWQKASQLRAQLYVCCRLVARTLHLASLYCCALLSCRLRCWTATIPLDIEEGAGPTTIGKPCDKQEAATYLGENCTGNLPEALPRNSPGPTDDEDFHSLYDGSDDGDEKPLIENREVPASVEYRVGHPFQKKGRGKGCSNSSEPLQFDGTTSRGSFLFIHKPTANPEYFESENYPFAEHMHKRARLWECRFQICPKVEVQGDVYFGCQKDKFVNLSFAQKLQDQAVTRVFKSFGAYSTRGDDPADTDGEAELPIGAFSIRVIDQLIVTEPDEEPPNLADPAFPTLGLVKTDNKKLFMERIGDLKFNPGWTYTFAFWSVARFLDVIGWRMPRRGLMPETRLQDIACMPPCWCVMYTLMPDPESNGRHNDSRHLESRKSYWFKICYWSSLQPPDKTRIREIELAAELPLRSQ